MMAPGVGRGGAPPPTLLPDPQTLLQSQPSQPLQGPARSSASPRDALAHSLACMQQLSAEPLALRPSLQPAPSCSLLYHDGSRSAASRRDTSGTIDAPASRNASSSPSPSAPAAPVPASLHDHSPSTPAAPPPPPPAVVGARSALCFSPLTRAEAADEGTGALVGAHALAQSEDAFDRHAVATARTQARASTQPARPAALPSTEHRLSPLGHATPRHPSVAALSQVGSGYGVHEPPLLPDTSVVAASSQVEAGVAASGEAWPSPGTVVTVTAEVLRPWATCSACMNACMNAAGRMDVSRDTSTRA